MGNKTQSQSDALSIWQRSFDEETDSLRVQVINGNNVSVNAQKESQIVKVEVPVFQDRLQVERIEVPVIVKEIEFKDIEKHIIIEHSSVQLIEIDKVIVTEKIVKVEVPVIVEKIVTVEIPTIIEKVVIKEIVKEVIVEKKEMEKFPTWLIVCIISQTVLSLITLIARIKGIH